MYSLDIFGNDVKTSKYLKEDYENELQHFQFSRKEVRPLQHVKGLQMFCFLNTNGYLILKVHLSV